MNNLLEIKKLTKSIALQKVIIIIRFIRRLTINVDMKLIFCFCTLLMCPLFAVRALKPLWESFVYNMPLVLCNNLSR